MSMTPQEWLSREIANLDTIKALQRENAELRTNLSDTRDVATKYRMRAEDLSRQLAEARAEVGRVRAENALWQNNSRANYEAFCAMRNDLNELFPVQSADADLLTGPEISVSCVAIVEAARAALTASAPATGDGWRTKAVDDVLAERRRQIEAEGWTPEHDDKHDQGELARAAGLYALITGADATAYRNARDGYSLNDYLDAVMKEYWPFDRSWFKPTNRYRDLVKAGALIIGELERLERLPAAPTATGGRG